MVHREVLRFGRAAPPPCVARTFARSVVAFRGYVLNIVGKIEAIETIAEGSGIRELGKLREQFGPGNWKKKKGIATLRVESGATAKAEIHWYEAHGIGKVKMKVKRWI